jgi:hypothetical protein
MNNFIISFQGQFDPDIPFQYRALINIIPYKFSPDVCWCFKGGFYLLVFFSEKP